MSLFLRPEGEGDHTVCEDLKESEVEDEKAMSPFVPDKATRIYADAGVEWMQATVAHLYKDSKEGEKWRTVAHMGRAWTKSE